MNRKLVLALALALLIGMLNVAFNIQRAKASETIYIRADGSVDPSTANIISADNVTYYFTNNIYDEIRVERGNIIINGNGYTLQGNGSGSGFILSDANNVTIENTNIEGFHFCICFYSSSNNIITKNNITNNYYGIMPYASSSNNITKNNITNNSYGIYLYYSSNNNITENDMAGNTHGIYLDHSSKNNITGNMFFYDGLFVDGSYGNVVVDNLVNGKPLVYLEGVSDFKVEDAGQVILINCTNITVENLNLSKTDFGIELWGTNSSTITQNNITNNDQAGINLSLSSNNNVTKNNITNNNWCGIRLFSSSNNSISGNNVTENGWSSICLYKSSNNTIFRNNVTENGWLGIELDYSSNNNIIGNDIAGNDWYGIDLDHSSNNAIYHNNFVDNSEQVYSYDSANVWDDGVEGNYWSDYNGTDSDNDGIGDSPYEIDENNADHFPLMGEFHKYHIWYIEPGFTLTLISNSTISNFVVWFWIEHPEYRIIDFNVAGETGYGFCRLCIPKNLMAPPYTVTIDNGQTPVTYYNETLFDNSTHRWIYFTYLHSEHQVEIIPEFPSFLILPLFMIATVLAVMVYRKKHNS